MVYGRFGPHSFRFGIPPFGFWWQGMRPFPRREEYLKMLEEYKKELEKELSDVEKEIEELKATH
jgi:hypothetical protein